MYAVKVALVVAGLSLIVPGYARAQAQTQGSAQSSGSYLGTWLWEVDPMRAREMRLPDEAHVVITRVSSGSPAEAAGLRIGDVVLEYDQKKVESNDQFSRLVRETPAGKTVRLRILRNGVAQTITAKIGTISDADRPGPITGAPPQIERQDVPRSLMTWNNALLGAEVEALFGPLAGYFGVADGVLVRSVTAGLPGAKAGLKAGDVILRVGKDSVSTPGEVSARLRLSNTPAVKLAVMRERREISLTVTLE